MVTEDKDDPRLKQYYDDGQQKAHLIMKGEERVEFTRPIRLSYVHAGAQPKYALRDLTPEELEQNGDMYVKYEEYPESEYPALGKLWSKHDLGCQGVTSLPRLVAETFAVNPKYYGKTFCAVCGVYLNVDQFVWDGTNERVGS